MSATQRLIEFVAGTAPSDKRTREPICKLLADGADAGVTLDVAAATQHGLGEGATLLHLAARRGNWETVQTLLQDAHIPWNSVDAAGVSAGEAALRAGHADVYEQLVDAGVRAEFVLAALGQRVVEDGELVIEGTAATLHAAGEAGAAGGGGESGGDDAGDDQADAGDAAEARAVANAQYLTRKLTFSEGRLLDSDGNAVMMGWEAPLMELHAKTIAPTAGLDVLNVGFGLGIMDTYLQALSPASHTIIEAHPDVYQKMLADGWDKKPGVRILFGRWQDVVDQLETYDGVFFDTFGEYYDELKEFHQILPNHLRETGVYSFFNGLAGTNQFFHDVSCRMADLDLAEIGMRTEFVEVEVDSLGDDVWRDTKRAYWSLPIYRLPIVRFDL
ncbi:Arginine N-methyltransferase 2 [Polyrhizophydium stewartii]|uniref:Arginine N-methyltransferase 2 n=1 Tax=Polyrhizophydium stewartii TaxID=2732419 RepID=A0ABR4N3S6_9FUNG